MDVIEKAMRKHFKFSLNSKLCLNCLEKYTNLYQVDKLLHMNAKAQSKLGTDSNQEEKSEAYDVARYVKASIAIIDKNKAMYFNEDLQEIEYFNPKNSIADYFYQIFNNQYIN